MMSDIWFPEPGKRIPSLRYVGSKGSNLITMAAHGAPVPPFFIIPSSLIKTWLEKLPSSAQDTGLMELLNSAHISESLNKAYDRICPNGELVSVRSSASVEDGQSLSFAGQFHTSLFVEKQQLASAITGCIASSGAANVMDYMQSLNFMDGRFDFAVIVQRMIHAERSGVAFSMHPGGNLCDLYIVAGYGSGEGVVKDLVETDYWIINRYSDKIHKNIQRKLNQMRFNDSHELVALDPAMSLEPVCSDAEILKLKQVILDLENLLGSPVDIEFSYDDQGDFHVLQMRPISTINPDEIKILDNTNIVESYPGISLPLTFDFAKYAYSRLFKSSARAFWVPQSDALKLTEAFENLIAHPYGRIYYRLDNWYRMISLVHQSSSFVQNWENAVGLSNNQWENKALSFRRKIRAYGAALWLALTFKNGNKRFFKNFSPGYKKLLDIEGISDDAKALWDHYEKTTAALFSIWYYTIINDFVAFQAFGFMKRLLSKQGLGDIANDLISGDVDNESEQALLGILQLKQLILEDPQLHELFQYSSDQVLSGLGTSRFQDFKNRFDAYLKQFGDRTMAELKLETISPRNNPELLIGMLRNQLSGSLTADQLIKRRKEKQELAGKCVRDSFSVFNPQTYFLNLAIAIARYALTSRENMRFCRTRAYSGVRDIFYRIGELLHIENLIESPSDVFYLYMNEIRGFANRVIEQPDFKQLVMQRKQHFEAYGGMVLPERIMYTDQLPHFSEDTPDEHASFGYLKGIGVSPGLLEAEVLVVHHPSYDLDVNNKILVTTMTDPGWVFLMSRAAGLISEKGSLLSHSAIVGRELGIPVIVNVPNATKVIRNGTVVQMDGAKGLVNLEKSIVE
jgi:rifampicin phosphotransferase